MSRDVVGRNIKRLRTEHGLTQKQLGEKIGAGQPMIGKWEEGKHLPGPGYLEKLAKVFFCNVSSFYVDSLFSGEMPDLPSEISGYNPVLETAKRVLRIHGYQFLPVQEYEAWMRIKSIASSPLEPNTEALTRCYTSPTIPFTSEAVAESPDVDWGQIDAPFTSESAPRPESNRVIDILSLCKPLTLPNEQAS